MFGNSASKTLTTINSAYPQQEVMRAHNLNVFRRTSYFQIVSITHIIIRSSSHKFCTNHNSGWSSSKPLLRATHFNYLTIRNKISIIIGCSGLTPATYYRPHLQNVGFRFCLPYSVKPATECKSWDAIYQRYAVTYQLTDLYVHQSQVYFTPPPTGIYFEPSPHGLMSTKIRPRTPSIYTWEMSSNIRTD